MYGIVTRNAEEIGWSEFDLGFFEVKDVTGRQSEPIQSGINMISCFGDTKRAELEPDLVPISNAGEPATRDRPYFDWGYICPSHNAYKGELLSLLSTCVKTNPAVRLDDIGFPRAEYCYCETCESDFQASSYSERNEWRDSVITAFVADAVARIPGRTYLTLYPNPYPGQLSHRSGIDITALEPLIDEFVIPLYDMAYTTTYWVEIIASGFCELLESPFSIELYAVNVDTDKLTHAAEVAAAYAENVFFAYDATSAASTIHQLKKQ